jgi:hypothetical protein
MDPPRRGRLFSRAEDLCRFRDLTTAFLGRQIKYINARAPIFDTPDDDRRASRRRGTKRRRFNESPPLPDGVFDANI